MDSLAEEVVDAIDEISGSHPGRRSAHAKGTLLAGTFTAAPEAAALTTAAHMQGDPVRVTARLSNGGGDPAIPDYAREGRGLAVKFYLPDGSKTDVIGLTMPCFFVRTPEDFLAFTQARMDPEKLMPAFLGAHPEALPAIQAALGSASTRQLRHLPVQLDPLLPAGPAPTGRRAGCAIASSPRRARRA